jgi:leucyl/phenylalanyl-tRNA--protein transferase
VRKIMALRVAIAILRAFALPSWPGSPHTMAMSRRVLEITPELVLRAYRHGLFPMAETRHGGRLFWLDPERRGVLPLNRFHLPRRLLRTIQAGHFEVGADIDFRATIAGCATAQPGRSDTWISPQIEHLFTDLHRMGYAHSVECWRDGELVGGLYGVAIGGVFFGESMFSFARDASKIALVHLVARLRLGGFQLLDTQFVTAHLAQFGAEEIPRHAYREQLVAGLEAPADWLVAPAPAALEAEFHALAGQSRTRNGIAP